MKPLLDHEDRELERALLEAGRDIHLSPRLRERTLAAMGIGAATLLSAGTGKAATLLGAKAKTWAVVLGVVAVGAGSAAVSLTQPAPTRIVSPAPAQQAQPVRTSEPDRSRAPERNEPALPARNERAAAREAPARQPPVVAMVEPAAERPKPATSEAKQANLRAELEYLDAASQALRAGNGTAALTHIETYRRSFPRGKLGLEAETLYIQALAASGRSSEARTRARRFIARHAKSPLAARVQRYTGEP